MAYVKIEERALLSIARLRTLLSFEFIIYNDGSLLIRNARALSIFDFTLRERLFIVFVNLSSCEFIKLFEIFRKYPFALPFSKKSISGAGRNFRNI